MTTTRRGRAALPAGACLRRAPGLTFGVCDVLRLDPQLFQVVPDPPAERDLVVGVLGQVHVVVHRDVGHLTFVSAVVQTETKGMVSEVSLKMQDRSHRSRPFVTTYKSREGGGASKATGTAHWPISPLEASVIKECFCFTDKKSTEHGGEGAGGLPRSGAGGLGWTLLCADGAWRVRAVSRDHQVSCFLNKCVHR